MKTYQTNKNDFQPSIREGKTMKLTNSFYVSLDDWVDYIDEDCTLCNDSVDRECSGICVGSNVHESRENHYAPINPYAFRQEGNEKRGVEWLL